MTALRPGRSLVALVVALAAACGTTDPSQPERPHPLGQELVVTGAVGQRIDATGFLMQTDGDDTGLLVVAPSQAVDAGDVVEVRGVVRRFERRAVEAELRRRLDASRYGRFEGVDFVRAERVVIRT